VHRKVWPAAQIFHAGVDGGAPGGGAATPETNQVRFRASHVYVVEPQLPYEQRFPRGLHAAPCAGASFGQPSVRFGWQRQAGSPGGRGTPLHGPLRTHEHLPSGYTHACPPAVARSSHAPLASANDDGHRASAAHERAAQSRSNASPHAPTRARFIDLHTRGTSSTILLAPAGAYQMRRSLAIRTSADSSRDGRAHTTRG
jgi:hypothetical protein